jgi:hypothetical protein
MTKIKSIALASTIAIFTGCAASSGALTSMTNNGDKYEKKMSNNCQQNKYIKSVSKGKEAFVCPVAAKKAVDYTKKKLSGKSEADKAKALNDLAEKSKTGDVNFWSKWL